MKKNVILVSFVSYITLSVGLIYLGLIYFKFNFDGRINNTLFFDIITMIAAVCGVIGLIYQTNRSRNLEEALFIVDLNKEYINNKDHQAILDIAESKDENLFTKEIIKVIPYYLDFFEPLYILIVKRIIKIEKIDDLFCYRFFSVVNNECVQKFVIEPKKEYFQNIAKLHYLWREHKRKQGQDMNIPNLETDLSKKPWYEALCENKGKRDEFHSKASSTSDISIREANTEDSSQINDLYFSLLNYKSDITKVGHTLKEILEDDNNIIFVACDNDNIVGTVQCNICQSMAFDCRPYMALEYLIVKPEYRRQGIAKKLMESVEDVAKQTNSNFIFLTSSKARKKAHKFYREIGFCDPVIGFRKELN